MYAIIATGGKQYKVSEGDIITIEKLGVEAGEAVTFDQVLAVNDGSKLVVGAPTVENASVSASVVKEGRGKKVIVYKYKRKTGYHKKNGHRQAFTQVKIEKNQRLIFGELLWFTLQFTRMVWVSTQGFERADTHPTQNTDRTLCVRRFRC